MPGHAPAEYADRAVAWNAVEKIEKPKNAQLARETEITLPQELSREQGISIVREYVKHNFVAAEMCADFAIRDKQNGNALREEPRRKQPTRKQGFNRQKQGGRICKSYPAIPVLSLLISPINGRLANSKSFRRNIQSNHFPKS